MGNKKIVVVGAGIAGLGAAYWLKKSGHDVQVMLARQAEIGNDLPGAFQNDIVEPDQSQHDMGFRRVRFRPVRLHLVQHPSSTRGGG